LTVVENRRRRLVVTPCLQEVALKSDQAEQVFVDYSYMENIAVHVTATFDQTAMLKKSRDD
jgi:hypothetical protein